MKKLFLGNFAVPALALLLLPGCKPPPSNSAIAPALTVALVSPATSNWPERISAYGSVKAWQESSIGNEIGGLKLEELLVEVGDKVTKGQLLARFDEETVRVELLASEAAINEAEANYDFAHSQAERVRRLEGSGSISQDQFLQATASEKMSAARLASSKAQLGTQRLRMSHTQVLAPDDGVISSRSATVGSVVSASTELFKMIRQNRLEWRATLPADQLSRIAVGQTVTLRAWDLPPVAGRVRQISPVVDTGTLTGLLYIDLPTPGAFKTGMFASGDIEFGSVSALHVPETSLVYRDGYQYVMKVDAQHKVRQLKVQTGRRKDDQVEIVRGITDKDQIVISGGAFLIEGDTVKVVEPTRTTAVEKSAFVQKSNGGRS
jgi:RND family efflux transporter MFP subunit